MKKLLPLLCCVLPLFGTDGYPEALQLPRGNYKCGEIEIVADPAKIEEIQQKYYERLRENGVPPDRANKWSKIGEIARDKYIMLVRDPVIFPTGATGLYDRLLSESKGGSAILPVFSNGDYGLIVQFRHATRAWELELPRGNAELGESPLDTAKRELIEETGFESNDWTYLGTMNPDSGMLQWSVPIFVARNVEEKKAIQDENEAIAGMVRLTKAELNKALKEGFLEREVNGQKRKINARDSFLTYALYLNSLL